MTTAQSGLSKSFTFDSPFFSTEASFSTRVVYHILGIIVVFLSCVSIVAPLIIPECEQTRVEETKGRLHGNTDYNYNPCWHAHRLVLFGMSEWECDMNVRVIVSLACGSLIGFERRRADRAAGIRTMALVCLGACVFTIASMFAFIGGPMAWDSSRVSAAIPSGVGFLGAASIWKGTRGNSKDDPSVAVPEVHGLTTATSVWLSSAVGILNGGKLYGPAIFTTAISVVYLRFAPRLRRSAEHAGGGEAEGAEPAGGGDGGAAGQEEAGLPGERGTSLETLLQPLNPKPITPSPSKKKNACSSETQLHI